MTVARPAMMLSTTFRRMKAAIASTTMAMRRRVREGPCSVSGMPPGYADPSSRRKGLCPDKSVVGALEVRVAIRAGLAGVVEAQAGDAVAADAGGLRVAGGRGPFGEEEQPGHRGGRGGACGGAGVHGQHRARGADPGTWPDVRRMRNGPGHRVRVLGDVRQGDPATSGGAVARDGGRGLERGPQRGGEPAAHAPAGTRERE